VIVNKVDPQRLCQFRTVGFRPTFHKLFRKFQIIRSCRSNTSTL